MPLKEYLGWDDTSISDSKHKSSEYISIELDSWTNLRLWEQQFESWKIVCFKNEVITKGVWRNEEREIA